MAKDRRDIAPLLQPYFATMAVDASSDDWHGFLNAITGLDVSIEEDNASAFDKWRMNLSDKGYPVWEYSKTRIADIQRLGEIMKAAELARIAALPQTLLTAAIAAPFVTAQALLNPVP